MLEKPFSDTKIRKSAFASKINYFRTIWLKNEYALKHMVLNTVKTYVILAFEKKSCTVLFLERWL